jgi:hypothetical protein
LFVCFNFDNPLLFSKSSHSIEECEGCTITLDGKVMSNVVETWKCTDLNLNINTVVSTLQLDLCKNLNIQFKRKEDFYSVIWAGIYGMKISFLNASM